MLSAGGFKGAFQFGAIKFLNENWHLINPTSHIMKYDYIAGVSVGAINGAFVGANKIEKLQEVWNCIAQNGAKAVMNSDFIDTESKNNQLSFKTNFKTIIKYFFKEYKIKHRNLLKIIFSKRFREKEVLRISNEFSKNFAQFKSLADINPLHSLIKNSVSLKDFGDTLFSCGLVSLNDGKYHVIRSSDLTDDENFIQALISTMSMPILYPPQVNLNTKKENLKQLVDGGLRVVVPIQDILNNLDADSSHLIIILNAANRNLYHHDTEKKDIANIAIRSMLDIAIGEIAKRDIEDFITLNEIKHEINNELLKYSLNSVHFPKKLQPVEYVLIEPDFSTEIDDPLVANKSIIEKRISNGYNKTKEVIEKYLNR